MSWKVKTDMRGQTKHGLWSPVWKTVNIQLGKCQESISYTFLDPKVIATCEVNQLKLISSKIIIFHNWLFWLFCFAHFLTFWHMPYYLKYLSPVQGNFFDQGLFFFLFLNFWTPKEQFGLANLVVCLDILNITNIYRYDRNVDSEVFW